MRRDKRVHKRLEIRPPPLRQRVRNLPFIIHALPRELAANWRQSLIQPVLEPINFGLMRVQVVAGELEEGVRDLQHEDMRVAVLVADEDAFAGAAHAMLFVVFLQSVETREDGRVFFGLVLFRAEGVVTEGVEADGFGLVGGEGSGEDGAAEVGGGG